MMEFLSPLALTGVLALAVPLFIHLLSSRDAVVVKVGSIKFLEKTEATTSRRPKLTELLLLLLRLALLVVITLLLAEPILKRLEKSANTAGWALVSSDVKNRVVDKAFYQTLDSLKAAGYEARLLAKDFPPIDDSDADIVTNNVWSLLKEADGLLPINSPLIVFTTDKLLELRGERPTLQRDVVWKTFSIDEEKKWIQSARVVGRDSVLVSIGESNATHTRLTTLLQHDNDARSQGASSSPQEPPSRALIFYDDNRKTDARYVEQGLRAVAGALNRSLQLDVKSSKETPQRASLIFWLSDKTPLDSLATSMVRGQNKSTMVVDAEGDGELTNGAFKFQNGETIELTRRSRARSIGVAVLYDVFGDAILDCETTGNLKRYFFYSRFSPDWNDLVLRGAFPEWLASLIEPTTYIDAKNDLRRASDFQRQPKRNNLEFESRPTPSKNAKDAALQTPLWILAAILFIIERIFSQQRALTS